MNRRQFLQAAAATAVAGTLAKGASAGGPRSGPPNVVFVFSDQQRWDTLSCSPSPIYPGLTPNLDRMAAEGVRFASAFTCQPVCGPARSCVLTGRYATETGCHVNGIALPLQERTLAHWLADAGYRTAYVGKWHLASGGPGGGHFETSAIPVERRGGFRDYWVASDVLEFTSHAYDGHMFDADMRRVDFPPGRYRADCLTDYALEFIRTADAARPFFLIVSYIEPHHQNDHRHFEGPRGSKGHYAAYRAPGDLEPLPGDWREELPDYLGCCAGVDANVGRIREELARRGLSANTLVVYTSDHGCHFRTRNAEYKRSCHDACLHIPLIACGPGFEGGHIAKPVVSLIDVPPTILAAAGIPIPATMRGHALQPVARGRTRGRPAEAFAQISESQVGRAIRTARWKYSVRAPGLRGGEAAGSAVYEEEFLYDNRSDPHQQANLVRDPAHTATRGRLAAVLKRRMAAAGESVAEIRPAAA